MTSQIDSFLQKKRLSKSLKNYYFSQPLLFGYFDIVTIWAGYNDFKEFHDDYSSNRPNDKKFVDNLMDVLMHNVYLLIENGAKTIIIMNLFNIEHVPHFKSLSSTDRVEETKKCVERFNHLLENFSLGIDEVIVVNTWEIIERMIDNPHQYNLTNVNTPCLNSEVNQVCPNPEEYLFYDNLQLASKAHEMIADSAFKLTLKKILTDPHYLFDDRLLIKHCSKRLHSTLIMTCRRKLRKVVHQIYHQAHHEEH